MTRRRASCLPAILAALLTALPAPHAAAAEFAAVVSAPAVPAVEAIRREATFAHTVVRPPHPSGRTLILLHGSGGDETSLLALASRIAPDATLLGIRGRVVQNGVKRWYRRITPTAFDQADIRAEADALAAFLHAKAGELGLELAGATFIGYSNGANMIAAMTQLHPGLVREAVLMRAMPVLSGTWQVDLGGTRILSIAGAKDGLYSPYAPTLEALLRTGGAAVEARLIEHGHGIGEADAAIAAAWLESAARPNGPQQSAAFRVILPVRDQTEKGDDR